MLTPTPSTPLPPSSGQSLSPPTSGTFGWARGPERDAGGEIVAQILPAYPRVGGDGQALARSVFGDAGLLIGCLGAALEEHQIPEEFCVETEAGQGGVRAPGSEREGVHPEGAEEAPGRLRWAPLLVFRGVVF